MNKIIGTLSAFLASLTLGAMLSFSVNVGPPDFGFTIASALFGPAAWWVVRSLIVEYATHHRPQQQESM
jgi:hypothetical protein